MSSCSSVSPGHLDNPASGAGVGLDGVASAIGRLRKIKHRQERLAKERVALEREVKAALGDGEVGTVGGQPVVTWKRTSRIAVSQHLLKQRYPEVARDCEEITEVRTFRLLP